MGVVAPGGWSKREAGPFDFSKIWSVTHMEPEEVLPLIISLQAVN